MLKTRPLRRLRNSIKKRFHSRNRPGDAPGIVLSAEQSTPSVVRLVQYNANELIIHENASLEEIKTRISPEYVTWIDVSGISDATTVIEIGRQLNLHPLALEDVVHVHQRPKVEMYGSSLFLIARVQNSYATLDTEQVSMFLGRHFVLSFHEHFDNSLEPVLHRLQNAHGRIRDCKVDYLLYALLDVIVDSYFPALEKYGERLDALDEIVSVSTDNDLIHQIHEIRSELHTLRRAIWPLRDAVNSLIRDSGDLISSDTDLYLRDCYDHVTQIIDVVETDRELCSDLRDYFLTMASNRMNQVMKFLTIIATIFIPLSFIAGLYGMNFNPDVSPYNMPELDWVYGYPMALGVMAAMAIGLLFIFYQKGWLKD